MVLRSGVTFRPRPARPSASTSAAPMDRRRAASSLMSVKPRPRARWCSTSWMKGRAPKGATNSTSRMAASKAGALKLSGARTAHCAGEQPSAVAASRPSRLPPGRSSLARSRNRGASAPEGAQREAHRHRPAPPHPRLSPACSIPARHPLASPPGSRDPRARGRPGRRRARARTASAARCREGRTRRNRRGERAARSSRAPRGRNARERPARPRPSSHPARGNGRGRRCAPRPRKPGASSARFRTRGSARCCGSRAWSAWDAPRSWRS